MPYQKKLFTRNILLTIGFMSSIHTSILADNVEHVAGAAFKNLRFAKAAAAPAAAPATTPAPQAATTPPPVAQPVAAPAPAAAPVADVSTANEPDAVLEAEVDQALPADDQAGDVPLEAEGEASADPAVEGTEDENPEVAA